MQNQEQNNSDDDVLFYSNDNISFHINELNTPIRQSFKTSYQNIQSPYLKAGSGNMVFDEPSKPKQINYDDILNSFNVQLQNGQLVVKSPDINSVVSPIFKSDPYQQQKQFQTNSVKPHQSARPQTKPVETKQPSLKNDSFYKFFKSHNLGSYVPENIQQKEEIPEMTPEELREYRRKKFLEQEAQRQRIRQIKSKNMFFYNGIGENVKIQPQRPQDKQNVNRLFNFNGGR